MADLESQDLLVDKIVAFLGKIGIEVRPQVIDDPTFLQGIEVCRDTLIVDRAKLKYPGDLLHEAGHLAVVSREERLSGEVGKKADQEILAIAWSYAAAVALDLEPSIVIHSGGFHGWREAFIETLNRGTFVGVGLLQELGLTVDSGRATEIGVAPYPHMTRWLL